MSSEAVINRIIYNLHAMKHALIQRLKIGSADMEVYITVILAAVLISSKEYFGRASVFKTWLHSAHGTLKRSWAEYLFEGEYSSLHSLLFWAASCALFYLFIPMAYRSWRNPQAHSLFRIHIPKSHWRIYGWILLLMIVPLVCASFLSAFQQTYPFVYIPRGEHFTEILFYWEIGYLLQFISVEYFFRGFLLFSFEKQMGKMAVIVPLIPYVMIHFGKPFPETLGAIVAGLVLGTMALRSRSIVPGILVHFSIAIGMDLLSLWQQGYFTVSK